MNGAGDIVYTEINFIKPKMVRRAVEAMNASILIAILNNDAFEAMMARRTKYSFIHSYRRGSKSLGICEKWEEDPSAMLRYLVEHAPKYKSTIHRIRLDEPLGPENIRFCKRNK